MVGYWPDLILWSLGCWSVTCWLRARHQQGRLYDRHRLNVHGQNEIFRVKPRAHAFYLMTFRNPTQLYGPYVQMNEAGLLAGSRWWKVYKVYAMLPATDKTEINRLIFKGHALSTAIETVTNIDIDLLIDGESPPPEPTPPSLTMATAADEYEQIISLQEQNSALIK